MASVFLTAVNGRGIFQLPPMGIYPEPWFMVEFAGPLHEGTPLICYSKRDTLADAIALAERLGKMGDSPDTF